MAVPDTPKVLMTFAFRETDRGGTHIESRVVKPKPKVRAFLEQVGAKFHETITNEVATLRQMLEGDEGSPAAVEEPNLPASWERFLSQPVPAR